MGGRTETFNQRIVKVVVPTLEGKERWRQMAKEAGFNGMSGWIRAIVAEWQTAQEMDVRKWVREVGELRERVSKLEKELELTRDAYENAKRELEQLREERSD